MHVLVVDGGCGVVDVTVACVSPSELYNILVSCTSTWKHYSGSLPPQDLHAALPHPEPWPPRSWQLCDQSSLPVAGFVTVLEQQRQLQVATIT